MAISKTRANYMTWVDVIISDDDTNRKVTSAQLQDNIAVEEFSGDVPRIAVQNFTGTGDFFITLPTSTLPWERGFSQVLRVFYPFVSTDQIPTEVDRRDWYIEEIPDTDAGVLERLRFKADSPSSAQTVRVTYSMRHTLSGTVNTIPDSYFNAVVQLICAHYYMALAGVDSHTRDSTIGADVVDYNEQESKYGRRSMEHRKEYWRLIGKKIVGGEPIPRAGGSFINLDAFDSHGRDRIHHRAAWR